MALCTFTREILEEVGFMINLINSGIHFKKISETEDTVTYQVWWEDIKFKEEDDIAIIADQRTNDIRAMNMEPGGKEYIIT